MAKLTILAPQTIVDIGPGVRGVVLSVQIMPDRAVRYFCQWWMNGSVNEMWFDAFQVEPVKKKDLPQERMGFMNQVKEE
jgi:hypothetical protein